MVRCYILATPANYFFRRSVPVDLREKLGKREIKITLKTGSKQEAAQLARELAYKTDLLFRYLRGEQMSSNRITIPGLSEMLFESKHSLPDGTSFKRKIDIPTEDLQLLLQAGSGNPFASKILSRIEEVACPPLEIAPALIAPPTTHNHANLPSIAATPLEEDFDCAIEYDHLKEIDVDKMRISEAITRYMEFGNELERWKNSKIEKEARADLVLLVDVLGDRFLRSVTPMMAMEFRKAIVRIPKRRKLSIKYRDRSLKDLINDTTIPASELFKPTYVNSLLISCSTLYHWAFKGAYNPFGDLKKKSREPRHAKRDSFTEEQLTVMFSHDNFTGDRPSKVYQYWSPLIALLTGMRQTEIAQLCLTDIIERDGIYGINMSEDTPGHTIKTDKSRRFVPIHKKLLELGFKERIEELTKRNETRIFPELYYWEKDPNREKPETKVYVGQTISKWFNGPGRFLESIGINNDKLVFHSFRKNFITAMVLNHVPEEDRTAIVGHEDGKAHDGYITKFDYQKLKEIIDNVDFSKSLENVKPWKRAWG